MDETAWDDRHAREDRFSGREPNRFLVASLKRVEPGTALVMAAGQGRNAVWLAEQGWRVTAVDYSAVALEKAAAFAAERRVQIAFERADLLEWEPESTYDLVTILYLQIPLPGRHVVWRSAASAVAAGGRLLIVGHDLRNLEEGYGGPSHPEVLYTAPEAAGIVGETLLVERAETVVRPVEAAGGRRYAIDNLVLARGG